jgi:hypothetical protein
MLYVSGVNCKEAEGEKEYLILRHLRKFHLPSSIPKFKQLKSLSTNQVPRVTPKHVLY